MSIIDLKYQTDTQYLNFVKSFKKISMIFFKLFNLNTKNWLCYKFMQCYNITILNINF